MNVNIGQIDALPPEIIQNKQFSRLNSFPRSSSDRLSNNFRMTNQSKISLTNKWAVERDKILGNYNLMNRKYFLPVIFFSLAWVNSLGLAPWWREGWEEDSDEGIETEEEDCEGCVEEGGVLRSSWVCAGLLSMSTVSPDEEVTCTSDTWDSCGPDTWPPTLFSLASDTSSEAASVAIKECFSGLQIVLPAVSDRTSSQSNGPLIGFPASKSKFHRLEASLRCFFNSFWTNLRFSSWSVGPNNARLTLFVLGGGNSSSELLLLEARLNPPGCKRRSPLMMTVLI